MEADDTTYPHRPRQSALPDKVAPSCRRISPEVILAVIQSQPKVTITEIARQTGYHPKSIANVLNHPEYRYLAAEYRADGFTRGRNKAEQNAELAVDALHAVLTSAHAKDSDRIAAARAMAALGEHYHRIVDVIPQVELLRYQVHQLTHGDEELLPFPVEQQQQPEQQPEPPPVMPTEPPKVFAPSIIERLREIVSKQTGSA